MFYMLKATRNLLLYNNFLFKINKKCFQKTYNVFYGHIKKSF